MRAQLAATGVTAVDRVILANATNAGNVARAAALAAGLGAETPASTVNNQCSGGLTALRMAAESIWAERADLVLAGGVESVSHTVVRLEGRASRRSAAEAPLPRVPHGPPGWPNPEMGPSADATAALLGIDREAQDAFAQRSYARAAAARAAGLLDGCRVAIPLPGGAVADDELATRPAPTLERLRRYPPAFGAGGTVTVGNCAAAADGAAVALLGSQQGLDAAGLQPLTRVLVAVPAAGDPDLPALAVIPAIERALREARLEPGDIDLWEINEAFAVKVVAAMRHFDIDLERMNVLGGAIAFGHPFAASGAILLAHLLVALEAQGAHRGLLAIAGAGGVAEAMIVERDDRARR